ncbi:sugar transferase [Clostridium chrysemydis]|uniref:sugar transferase n=1 Tax=Clostridium chrysemydis TaxID=2665504 RepID=UPI00188416D2|nr:sugar transferase [Clostridium chrysemydis]
MNNLKRILDIIFSLCALIILSPIFLGLYILIKFKLGSPVIFKQERVGIKNRVFTMYKFRTMNDLKDDKNNLLPDYLRLTKFGKIIRSLSLDELPELFNILKGDMSLIGPRPLLVEYLKLYDGEQIRRHDVLPGLTGFAQINGRNNLKWSEKFKLDVWYVDNWSLKLDIKIFFLTIYKVLKREGISGAGEITVSKFTGLN